MHSNNKNEKSEKYIWLNMQWNHWNGKVMCVCVLFGLEVKRMNITQACFNYTNNNLIHNHKSRTDWECVWERERAEAARDWRQSAFCILDVGKQGLKTIK